ncbi:cytochrome P450 CYP72A219-like [Rhododendron vialii]|uniref:cytochrome P450 CYP72A219-like n=1 Tax=Rhododendron vialii TaxID=182163 RepID=UPI00265E2A91|nr:cytochrome P450 CYP72A219-like [Rhododendron vialii]
MRLSEAVASIVLSLALVTFLTLAWKALNLFWLRPKQIERCLREQGFKGNSYRFLYGDTKEFISAIKEARSKPLEACNDDVVRRVMAFHRYFVDLHGMNYFTWLGPTPRLNIMAMFVQSKAQGKESTEAAQWRSTIDSISCDD